MPVAAEGDLGTDQIHLPHPAEPLVVELAYPLAVVLETAPPGAQRLGVVEAQDLDVGDPQPGPLGFGDDLGQGRRIAAREDVLAQPGVGRARSVHAADRVQQGDPVGRQELAQPAEIGRVLVDPDMLEHADRDDAVVASGLLAVVAQVKPHPVAEARRRGAPRRHLVLLLGQGEPGDVGAAFAGEIERQPAPARADIEHPQSRAQQQLCRDVALLVLLRGVEIVLGRPEIRTGILPVVVEEQLIELVRQIVVVGDVAARARDRVVLVQAPHEAAGGLAQPQRQRVGLGRVVRHQDVDEIVEGAAFLDGQRAGHKGLRNEQPGLQQQFPMERRVVQPDGRRGAWRALEHMPPAGGIDDAEPADADEAGEHRRKQHGTGTIR